MFIILKEAISKVNVHLWTYFEPNLNWKLLQ